MRIEQLTFTRFIAALSIVVFHYGGDTFPFNSQIISFLFEKADVGVSYFFVLSGFVMIIAYGYQSHINPLRFLLKRLVRIYPVYILSMSLLLINFLIVDQRVDYVGLILNIFFLQSWVPGKALAFNYPSWSLSVEFFFYLVFPFSFNFIYQKKKLSSILPIVFGVWIVSQIMLHIYTSSSSYEGYPTASFEFAFMFPLMHLNEFLLGNILGLYFITQGIKKEQDYDLIIIVLVVMLIVVLKYCETIHLENGLLAVFFLPLIFLISLNNGWLTKTSNWKCSIFLGEISYGIYILQAPVFKWCGNVLYYFDLRNPNLVFYVSLIALLLSSSISYWIIEQPIRLSVRKALNKKSLK